MLHLVVRSVKQASDVFVRNKAVLLSKEAVSKANDNTVTYQLFFELQDAKKSKVSYSCCRRMYETVKEGEENILISSQGKLIQFGQNVNVEE